MQGKEFKVEHSKHDFKHFHKSFIKIETWTLHEVDKSNRPWAWKGGVWYRNMNIVWSW
jgi:hypothetical protein